MYIIIYDIVRSFTQYLMFEVSFDLKRYYADYLQNDQQHFMELASVAVSIKCCDINDYYITPNSLL